MTAHLKPPKLFHRIPAIYKLLMCLAGAAIVTLSLLPVRMEVLTRIMIGWDVFSLIMISISLEIFLSLCSKEIRVVAGYEDASRPVVFSIVVVATLCSLAGILLLLGNKGSWLLGKGTETFIYIIGVIFSWVLLHIMYTYRYAHCYYGDHATVKGQIAGGLVIPDETRPDYIDFAYFSFVIGMTFQVSDIQINSRAIRRIALVHSLLSFLFNTVIVALTINAVVELRG